MHRGQVRKINGICVWFVLKYFCENVTELFNAISSQREVKGDGNIVLRI